MNSTLHGHAMEAIRFWERGRVIYNGVLLLVTAVCVGMRWPDAHWFFRENFDDFVTSVVIANVLYCAAYFVEPLFLVARIRARASRLRWAILLAGTAFASLLAFVDLNMVLLVEPFLD